MSSYGVMRGLHYQRMPYTQSKLMLCLKEEFGISDGQQIQRFGKEQRVSILAAMQRRHASVRQLQRLTGISKNIISNVSKTIYVQTAH